MLEDLFSVVGVGCCFLRGWRLGCVCVLEVGRIVRYFWFLVLLLMYYCVCTTVYYVSG